MHLINLGLGKVRLSQDLWVERKGKSCCNEIRAKTHHSFEITLLSTVCAKLLLFVVPGQPPRAPSYELRRRGVAP